MAPSGLPDCGVDRERCWLKMDQPAVRDPALHYLALRARAKQEMTDRWICAEVAVPVAITSRQPVHQAVLSVARGRHLHDRRGIQLRQGLAVISWRLPGCDCR
jgi:hypothetical protein